MMAHHAQVLQSASLGSLLRFLRKANGPTCSFSYTSEDGRQRLKRFEILDEIFDFVIAPRRLSGMGKLQKDIFQRFRRSVVEKLPSLTDAPQGWWVEFAQSKLVRKAHVDDQRCRKVRTRMAFKAVIYFK